MAGRLGRLSSRIRGYGHAAHALRTCAIVQGLLLPWTMIGLGAQEAPVTWALFDAPPFMIAEGPDADRGVSDQIRHLLDDRLAGAPQRTLRAPWPRVLASLKDGTELCFIGGVKTPERDDFAVFSLPTGMFYPMRLVVHAPEAKRFEARAPLSLPALLADRSLRTSVLRNRSLGSKLDALLLQIPPLHVHSEFGEAFRMLLADRLDYLMEYSAIASYVGRSMGQSGAFLELPLAETPDPVFSRVMCPKTEWGRRLVARIDAILRVERKTEAYRRIVEAWVREGDLSTVRGVYDRSFLESE